MIKSKIFVLFILIISCSSQQELEPIDNRFETIPIDVGEKEPIKMSTVFSDIEYLPLKAEAGKLIGRIEKIIFKEDKIFILESSHPSIFIYDQDGNYINQVKVPEGHGPGELTYISDFVVYSSNQEISVLGAQRINTYTYSGEIVDEQNLKIAPRKFGLLPNGDFVFYMSNSLYENEGINNYGFNLIYRTREGNLYKKALPIKKSRAMLSFEIANNFPSYKSKQLFYGSPDYHIYELTSDSIKIRYYLDFGDHKIPESLFNERENFNDGVSFGNKILEEGYASMLSSFNETEQVIYFRFFNSINSHSLKVFHYKKNGNTLVTDSLINDIDYGLTPPFWFHRDDQLAMFVQPTDLIQKAKEIKNNLNDKELEQYRQQDQNLIDLTSEMKSMNNPILMFCKLKSYNN